MPIRNEADAPGRGGRGRPFAGLPGPGADLPRRRAIGRRHRTGRCGVGGDRGRPRRGRQPERAHTVGAQRRDPGRLGTDRGSRRWPQRAVRRLHPTGGRDDADEPAPSTSADSRCPVATTPFEAAVAAATTSWLGTGGASYRVGGEEGPVDTVFLGVFDRAAIEAVGLFDERLIRNQDYELNIRLRKAGGTVWFDPGAVGRLPATRVVACARQAVLRVRPLEGRRDAHAPRLGPPAPGGPTRCRRRGSSSGTALSTTSSSVRVWLPAAYGARRRRRSGTCRARDCSRSWLR